MKPIKRKYHYFYKITNNINNHYYFGIHSTDNLDDGYMGSGTRLKYAYEKYGIENFTKDILKFFDTREELAKYESEVVTEVLVKDNNCYNISLGGGSNIGMSNYKDSNNNIFRLYRDDPRVLSGEVQPYMKGIGIYKDNTGKNIHMPIDDPRVLSGEVESMNKGKVIVKDSNNKIYFVSKTDPRYASGELKHFWIGKKHKPETIEKFKKTYKEIGHQQGEKNSQYGTCWITKDGINKKIKKEELNNFEKEGWKKGRICKK